MLGCKDKAKETSGSPAGAAPPCEAFAKLDTKCKGADDKDVAMAKAMCESFAASKTPDDPLVKSMRAQIDCAKNGSATCDEYKVCVEKIGQ
jgi:hypothetical protein